VLGAAYSDIGDALLARHDRTGALAQYRQALPIGEALIAKDATNAKGQQLVAESREHIAALGR